MTKGDPNFSAPIDEPVARRIDQATGDAPRPLDERGDSTPFERAAAALHAGLTPRTPMPPEVSARLMEAAAMSALQPVRGGQASSLRLFPVMLTAACLAVAAGAVWVAYQSSATRARLAGELASAREQLSRAQEQVRANETMLAEARGRVSELDSRLAEQQRRGLELASQLTSAMSQLDDARLRIARLETPADPAETRMLRQKLLEVPDTIRIAWKPFDLPDAPAEQHGIEGDVVWNDGMEQGFLRFVGLKVNDPAVEQYQVWVIDERGMEQKVSGGVFNATAEGEVIVPLKPGIDIRRVALFAVTIEEPGGTWVPDLRRRVVVAPREES